MGNNRAAARRVQIKIINILLSRSRLFYVKNIHPPALLNFSILFVVENGMFNTFSKTNLSELDLPVLTEMLIKFTLEYSECCKYDAVSTRANILAEHINNIQHAIDSKKPVVENLAAGQLPLTTASSGTQSPNL
jgi:hypothetical protein